MSEAPTNYYHLLGVGQQATTDAIRAAYLKRFAAFNEAFTPHDSGASEQLGALRQAFKVLSDPQARAAYDATLATTLSTVATMPPHAGQQATTSAEPSSEERFEFVGTGGEYFRIWIVNLFLTVLTLGIYSAWAKVRREQYFHRNLLLDASGFNYHGRPSAILVGRILALLLLGWLSWSQRLSPWVYLVSVLCVIPLFPWLAVKALRFRAHNTSYRGLRFSFHGTYGQALKVFVGYALLAAVTLGLAFPVFYRQLRKFVLDNLRFGTTQFECSVTTWTIYKIFLLPGIVFFALIVGIGVFTAAAFALGRGKESAAAIGMVFLLIPVLIIVFQALLIPYLTARTTNAIWGTTRLGHHQFVSSLPVGRYIGLTLLNWLAIIVTLGLFIPWAQVRVARFRAEYLVLQLHGSLDDFVAGQATAAAAIGEEAAEIFGLDIGL